MRALATILWLAQILLIVISWRFLPPQIPLFYSRPWGEEQLTTPPRLFILPIFSIFIYLANNTLLSFLSKEEKLISQILLFTVVLFNFLGLVTLIQIIRLVI